MADEEPSARRPPQQPGGLVSSNSGRPAKLGAAILVAIGILWTVNGVHMIVASFGPESFDMLSVKVFFPLGLLMIGIAVLEIVTGLFAWRGSNAARYVGIGYALVFGLVSLYGTLNVFISPFGGIDVQGLIYAASLVGYGFILLLFAALWGSSRQN